MSFVEQEDVFEVVEKLMIRLFKKFSPGKSINEKFPRIPYLEAMAKYGTDKPDLRNPLIIEDITNIFTRKDVEFEIFKKLVKSGSVVKVITTKKTKDKPRSFLLIISINGQKSKAHQVLHILQLKKTKK